MMGGTSVLRRADAEEFFDAVRTNVEPGDVIHIDDGSTGNLIAGATGRWTTSGILRDVRSEQGRVRAEECDFAAVLSGGMGMPGPGGGMGSRNPPSKFEKVFENDYGALYRNPAKVEHAREPHAAEVSLPLLAIIAIVGILLVVVDCLPRPRPRVRLVAAAVGSVVVALCFLPLTSKAIDELRNPPSVSSQRWEGGPGGPPGFGGPGGGPGQFIAESLLRGADADKNSKVSLDEFRALAGRWFQSWDANRNGTLELEEVSQGLQSIVGGPSGTDGPMNGPGGPPGFGPGAFLGQRVFSSCDSNGDGKLTRDEWVGAFERWFREWDEGSKGSLDAAALGRGLDRLIGPSPMFGPPN